MDSAVGQLACRFIDRRSSFPLAGAYVMCVWPDRRMSSIGTDDHGQATLELPEGSYDLVVSAKGYLSMPIRGVGVLGGHRTEVQRGLLPGDGHGSDEDPSTAVGGYIRDRLGHPLVNLMIQVVVETLSVTDSGKTYAARTDNRGAYLLHGVGNGNYDLVVRASDRVVAREKISVTDIKHFVRRDITLLS